MLSSTSVNICRMISVMMTFMYTLLPTQITYFPRPCDNVLIRFAMHCHVSIIAVIAGPRVYCDGVRHCNSFVFALQEKNPGCFKFFVLIFVKMKTYKSSRFHFIDFMIIVFKIRMIFLKSVQKDYCFIITQHSERKLIWI